MLAALAYGLDAMLQMLLLALAHVLDATLQMLFLHLHMYLMLCYTDASSCICTCTSCYAMEKDIRWRKPAHNSVIACGTTLREYPQSTNRIVLPLDMTIWRAWWHLYIYIYMLGFRDEGPKDLCGKVWAKFVSTSSVETWPARSLESKKCIKCCEGCPKSISSVTLPWLVASQINTSPNEKC